MQPKYKRILLKLSGESLAGGDKHGINNETVLSIGRAIKACADMGVEIGIVVGGGNFWRGRSSGSMDRTRADHVGMLATVMNALCVADALGADGGSRPRADRDLHAAGRRTLYPEPGGTPPGKGKSRGVWLRNRKSFLLHGYRRRLAGR